MEGELLATMTCMYTMTEDHHLYVHSICMLSSVLKRKSHFLLQNIRKIWDNWALNLFRWLFDRFISSLLDFHPSHPGVLLVSPCSGHGFKVRNFDIFAESNEYFHWYYLFQLHWIIFIFVFYRYWTLFASWGTCIQTCNLHCQVSYLLNQGLTAYMRSTYMEDTAVLQK